MSKKTRAVLVGCGRISRIWLTATQGMTDLEIVGMVDLEEKGSVRLNDQWTATHAVVPGFSGR